MLIDEGLPADRRAKIVDNQQLIGKLRAQIDGPQIEITRAHLEITRHQLPVDHD